MSQLLIAWLAERWEPAGSWIRTRFEHGSAEHHGFGIAEVSHGMFSDAHQRARLMAASPDLAAAVAATLEYIGTDTATLADDHPLTVLHDQCLAALAKAWPE